MEKENKTKDVKVIKIENLNKELKNQNLLARRYRGICRDGTTFSAGSRKEAQDYVNGYCRGLRAQ